MKIYNIGMLLIAVLMMALPVQLAAQQSGAKNDHPYYKLFKGKAVKTQQGLVTLHKADGKLYMEFPVALYEKDMLLGSVAESVSNSEDAAAGEQAHDPLCIHFTMIDSTVYIRSGSHSVLSDADSNLVRAMGKNHMAPILAAFKILAVSPDSQRVVFDATSFFVNGNKQMDPFLPVGGLYGRRTAYKAENSLLADIAAYEDNVVVSSYLSYGITSTFFGFTYEQDRPATVLMKRTLVLLPEQPMRSRLSDPRVGAFFSEYQKYSDRDNGVQPVFYANRWKLEPADTASHKRGELVQPVKPIIFYIDDKFPAHWIPYIKQGVEDWNKAFEKIGFKNAIVTLPYPKNDTAFDPNNIKYNCIKYAPTQKQNAMGPFWVDPRSGEILHAGVYVYHGMVDLLSDWLFIQTAAADERVRTKQIPADIMGRGIRYVLAHELGHCLGLMHNMGASSAFPVDSLRSATFTQQYGITPSIMDYARFNFVAQPGDLEKGVRLTPPELGVYDEHVIRWLYTPLYGTATPEEEVPTLDKWVAEKIVDPKYRYGKQQLYGVIDPNAQTEDLGDDQVAATRYAISNLQYIMKHMNKWVHHEDSNYLFRRTTNFALINIHFYWYWMHVLYNIGGIYQYEKYEGDPLPAYKVVPRETQKRSVLFALEALEKSSWMNNPEFENNIDALNGNAGNYMRSALFPYLMRWISRIGLSEAKTDSLPYTRAECIGDVFNYIWGDALKGKKPVQEKLEMQALMVQVLIQNADVLPKRGAAARALQPEDEALVALEWKARSYQKTGLLSGGMNCGIDHKKIHPGDVEGMGYMQRIAYQSPDIAHIYYGWLLQCRDILQKTVATQTGDIKVQYQYMLLQINRALKQD